MHHTHCSSKILVCIRQQLFALFLCWLAAAGISILFVILPGCQTLRQFQSTRCTAVRASRSGENPCTFCLQIHVFTEHAPSVERQLQQDEVIDDVWCTFKSSCEMDNEVATALLDEWTTTYGENGSTYSCFSHKSEHSDLTVLKIKKYPLSAIIQLILWLCVSFFILIACLTHMCKKSGGEIEREKLASGYRISKASSRVLNFQRKWADGNSDGENKI